MASPIERGVFLLLELGGLNGHPRKLTDEEEAWLASVLLEQVKQAAGGDHDRQAQAVQTIGKIVNKTRSAGRIAGLVQTYVDRLEPSNDVRELWSRMRGILILDA